MAEKHFGESSLIRFIGKIKTELNLKEDTENKSASLSSANTDEQYPTSKAVCD